MKNIFLNQKGFTLVETIVAIFIFTLLILGATNLFSHIFKNSRNQMIAISDIDQAQLLTKKFINEIRTASIGENGNHPIALADDQQVVFYSRYGQEDNRTAQIRYFLEGTNLKKGVIIPSGSPISYNSTAEKVDIVQNNIVGTTTPVFYYYSGDYDGQSDPLTQPVNVNDIKYIKIKFFINKPGLTDIFNVQAGATIRNLKNNLGN